MRNHSLLLFCTLLFSSSLANAQKSETLIFDRIEFVLGLKQVIDSKVWQDVNEKKFDVPLVYFTETSSYVANPTQKFLSSFPSKQVYRHKELVIYKTKRLIDNIPFHMFTGMTMGTPTKKYDYHSPFMKCSSFEIAKKTIPAIQSTEEWATWIVHEYFHGFQYKHASYLIYLEKNTSAIDRDSLQTIYVGHDWFKQGIDKENNLLLRAIQETDKQQINNLVDSFFVLRTQRRQLAKQLLGFDTRIQEKMYETMEGTARYIEYSLYAEFENRMPDSKLLQSDSSFHSFKQYNNYRLDAQPWLYNTARSAQYFYATGFNLARLLDKLKIEYKTRLFNQGALSLEEILQTR